MFRKVEDPDHIKVIEYSIFYSERDHEAILDHGQRVVSGASNEEALRTEILSEFLKTIEAGRTIPSAWQSGKHPQGNFGYQPDNNNPSTFRSIPDDSVEFVHVSFYSLATQQTAEGSTDELGVNAKAIEEMESD